MIGADQYEYEQRRRWELERNRAMSQAGFGAGVTPSSAVPQVETSKPKDSTNKKLLLLTEV